MGFGGWNNIPWCKPTYRIFTSRIRIKILLVGIGMNQWIHHLVIILPSRVVGGNFDELPFFILGYNSDNSEINCLNRVIGNSIQITVQILYPPPSHTPTPSPTGAPPPEQDYLLIRWRLGSDFKNYGGQIIPKGTIFYSKYISPDSDINESDLTASIPGLPGQTNVCRFTRWWGIPVEYMSTLLGNYNNAFSYMNKLVCLSTDPYCITIC